MHLKYKILIIILAALGVILGSALITHIVLSEKQQRQVAPNNNTPPAMGRGMLIGQLNFNDEQIRIYDSLRNRFFECTLTLRDSIELINRKIANALISSHPNRQEVLLWVQEANRLENRYKRILIIHILDLHQICNREQRVILGQIYPQLMGRGQGKGRGMMYRHRWGRQQQF